MTAKSDILFEPVKIGPVTAPNRFYAAPHATGHGHSQPNGARALRAMKAEGGWGTVCVSMTEIAADSDLMNHPLERLWDDTHLPTHAAHVAAIKDHGALAAIELAHGGMRSRNFTTGQAVPGPSDLPILRPEVPLQARAMDRADIRAFRAGHKEAARLAKRAGYDILYAYAAHDLSLLSHFLSRRYNFRDDAYGGSLENRSRLLREVLEDLHEVAAGDCAVALRFSVHEFDQDTGLTSDGEGRDLVEMLADLPDLWDVNVAGWPHDSKPSRFSDEGIQLDHIAFVKQVTNKPVVGVGRFTAPETMRRVIRDGLLDLIGAARPSIADPFLPRKVRDGREDEIRECIGCNVCVAMDSYGVPLRCTQNPTIAEEWRRGWHPEKVARAKKRQHSLIVGAGPAGLEAALTLVRGGHRVTLAERGPEAGGRVLAESRMTGFGAWRRVLDYRINILRQSPDFELFLESDVDKSLIDEVAADHVLLATGAAWRRDGVGATRFTPRDLAGVTVLTPDDVLAGTTPSGPVLVFDDEHNYMATALAADLARKGCGVTYATTMPEPAPWTGNTLEQRFILQDLKTLGVNVLTVQDIEGAGPGTIRLSGGPVPADTLVLVGARLPEKSLWADLGERGNTRRIGDANVPGFIQAAVLSGHVAAREILAGRPTTLRHDHPRLDP